MRREPNSQESCIPKRGKREEANEVLNMHMLNVHMHTLLKSCVTTFENKSWIDLSTAGSKIADNITNWRVRNDESLSFHKIITFTLNQSPSIYNKTRYNFDKTNWTLFNTKLSDNFLHKNISINTVLSASGTELDKLCENISLAIKETIISHVPSTKNYKKRLLLSWWNKDISNLRKSVNNARRKKQKNATRQNIDSYRSLRNKYKNIIRKSKHEDFSNSCKNAESPWELHHSSTPSLLKDDGTYTLSDTETCNFLLEKWFPDDDSDNDQDVHLQTRQHVQ